MGKIIAVIPAYNEASRITPVITKAKTLVDEVIVIDDHSKDTTYQIAKKAGATTVRLITNMGAGFATRTGCDLALEKGATYIVTLDADGQHDPNEIPLFINPLKQGKDMVFGCRQRNKNMPAVKRLGNWGLTTICKILFGIQVNDSQSGFRAFSNTAYQKLRWTSERYGVVSEIVANASKHKLSYQEVIIKTIYNDKEAGMGKIDAVKSVMSMLKWRLLRW